MDESGNLFADIPGVMETEQFADLYAAPRIRIERIVSTGQATPTLEWLDRAGLDRMGRTSHRSGRHPTRRRTGPRTLEPGDWLLIPARKRHRVEWTDLSGTTIWLAVDVGV